MNIRVSRRFRSCILAGMLSGHCLVRAEEPDDFPDLNCPATMRDHVIMVDKDGAFKDPPSVWLTACPSELKDIRAQMKRIDERLKSIVSKGHPRICIRVFAHGGLNSLGRDGSFKNYQKLFKRMYEADPHPKSPTDPSIYYYPIFIVWNSGPFATYGDHLFSVRQGRTVSKLEGYLTSPLVLGTDLVEGVVRMPITWIGEIKNDVATTERKGGRQERDHNEVEEFLQKPTGAFSPNSPSINLLPGENRRTPGDKIRYAISYTVTIPTKYGSTFILEGIGVKAWDIMVRRTLTMFDPRPIDEGGHEPDIYAIMADTNDPKSRTNALETWYNDHLGVGSFFSRWLRWRTNHEPHDDRKPTLPVLEAELYGHSMGAMVINNLIAREPKMHVQRIAYMGAACRIRDWIESVWPYLNSADGNTTEFYSVSLHRLREANERNPVIGSINTDLTMRGSLLNWIDNLYSNPTTLEARTLGSWDNVTRIAPQIPDELRSRIFLHCFDAVTTPNDGPSPQPQSHGELTNWPFWQHDYLFPVSNADVPHRFEDQPDRPLFVEK